MKIKRSIIDNIFIFMTFFSMGFYQFQLTLLFFLISFLLLLRGFSKNTLNKDLFIYFYLTYSGVILFYLFSFINGMYDNFNNIGEVAAVILFVLICFLLILIGKFQNYSSILNGFIFGLGGYSLICLWTTMYEIGQVTAYSKVWNPFLEVFQNSPTHAINLALLVTLLLINIKESRKIISKIFYVSLLFVCIYFGLYSGSRVFILISIISMFFTFFNKKYLISAPFILFIAFVFFSLFEDFFEVDKLTAIDRITSEGSESGRYNLYKLGLNNLFVYPFGGYNIDSGTYGTIWNHNLFLDIARMSGLVPLFLIIFSYIFLFKKILKNLKIVNRNFLLIFVCLFILMMQDVVFTGHYMMFILSFIISSILMVSLKGENYAYK